MIIFIVKTPRGFNEIVSAVGVLGTGVSLFLGYKANNENKALKSAEDKFRASLHQRLERIENNASETSADLKILKDGQSTIINTLDKTKKYLNDFNFSLSSIKEFF